MTKEESELINRSQGFEKLGFLERLGVRVQVSTSALWARNENDRLVYQRKLLELDRKIIIPHDFYLKWLEKQQQSSVLEVNSDGKVVLESNMDNATVDPSEQVVDSDNETAVSEMINGAVDQQMQEDQRQVIPTSFDNDFLDCLKDYKSENDYAPTCLDPQLPPQEKSLIDRLETRILGVVLLAIIGYLGYRLRNFIFQRPVAPVESEVDVDSQINIYDRKRAEYIALKDRGGMGKSAEKTFIHNQENLINSILRQFSEKPDTLRFEDMLAYVKSCASKSPHEPNPLLAQFGDEINTLDEKFSVHYKNIFEGLQASLYVDHDADLVRCQTESNFNQADVGNLVDALRFSEGSEGYQLEKLSTLRTDITHEATEPRLAVQIKQAENARSSLRQTLCKYRSDHGKLVEILREVDDAAKEIDSVGSNVESGKVDRVIKKLRAVKAPEDWSSLQNEHLMKAVYKELTRAENTLKVIRENGSPDSDSNKRFTQSTAVATRLKSGFLAVDDDGRTTGSDKSEEASTLGDQQLEKQLSERRQTFIEAYTNLDHFKFNDTDSDNSSMNGGDVVDTQTFLTKLANSPVEGETANQNGKSQMNRMAL